MPAIQWVFKKYLLTEWVWLQGYVICQCLCQKVTVHKDHGKGSRHGRPQGSYGVAGGQLTYHKIMIHGIGLT